MEHQAQQTRMQQLEKEHRRVNRVLWLCCSFAAFLLTLFVLTVWFMPLYIGGDAMAPTLEKGDAVMVNTLSKYVRYLKRGDIVAFRHPVTGENEVKRVIALEGETVYIRDGAVYLNNKYILDESDYVTNAYYSLPQLTVPAGCVFVLSDVRAYGDDSRDATVGCIPVDAVRGVVKVRLTRFALLS